MQHTLLVHLFVAFLHYYKVKLFNYKFYVFCSHKIVVSCALFHSLSFSLPLIFTLLAANISHFLTTKKRATFFATLLQNELNSDVARFTTHIKPVLKQIRLQGLLSCVVKRATSLYRTLKFSACVSKEILLLCFSNLALALSLLSTSTETLFKYSRVKDSALLLFFFLSLNFRVAKMTITWTSIFKFITGCGLRTK